MNWLMGVIGATVAGWLGSYIFGMLFGPTAGFILGIVASGFGMYYAVKWSKNTFGR